MSRPDAIFEIHSGIVLKGQLSMVKDVILTGRFEGDLKTLGRLTVTSGGTMVGDVEAGALVLEPGYNVDGRIKVSDSGPVKAKASAPAAKSDKPATGIWPLSLQKLKDFALGRK